MKRRVIAAVTPKGGSGKTTLCIHLAAKHELEGGKVLAIDLDPTGAFTLWCRLRQSDNIDVVRLKHDQDITKLLESYIREHSDKLIIIDTGGFDTVGTRSTILCKAVDAVLIPAKASLIDLAIARPFILETMTALKGHEKFVRGIVMEADPLPNMAEQTLTIKGGFKGMDLTPLTAITHRRGAYKKGFLKGQDGLYDPKALAEITEVYDEVTA